jgi:hypothetical protein
MALAPPWAFSAEAIDGIGDTHLAKGIHIRALPSPSAGLPATPLFVYRALLNADAIGRAARHTEVIWIDSFGNLLTAPFQLTPNNPVIGHLTAGTAIWARLQARPLRPEGISFAALVNGPGGLIPFARRDADPWVVGGQRIDAVQVSGRGTVLGLRWIERDEGVKFGDFKLIAVWSLPVDPAPRYRPTPNARSEAKDRVARGAPTRLPQYAVMGQTDPANSPPAGDAFSLARLGLLDAELDRWLKRLLNDLSQPTFDLQDIQPVEDADGTIALSIEPHLIGASIDPDAGHWLGFGDVDALDAPAGDLALYQIRGLWRDAPERWDALQRPALASRWVATLDEAVARFEDLRKKDLVPDQKGPFLDLTALAVAVVGAPPSRPGLPGLLGFEDRGWLPEPPPPDVRRHVRIRLIGMAPRALLAAVADDGVTRTLNPVIGEGRPKPGEVPSPETMMAISVTRPPDATVVGETRIDDRDAQENGAKYRIAQGDWFGRWGEWADHLGPPKARTAPPAPALELTYRPPSLPPGGSVPNGPLSGTLTFRVAIPRTDDLPPGGHPLNRLELSQSTGGGAPAVTTILLGAPGTLIEVHPAPLHDILLLTRAGPPLGRAAATTVAVTARWIDEAGLVSVPSAPAQRTILDPRPPALPVVPTTLLYSARPDATGFARVELVWPSVPGTRYRVFASSEPTLLGALRNAGRTAIADAIAATPAGAPRATAIKAQRALFSWDAFESVTANPIIASGTSTSFVHRVSGSLDVLAAYRVLTEGPSGVLAEISQAEIIPVAVPNFGPPPPPLASLGALAFDQDVTTDGVPLDVLVPPGRAAPIAWRVRRSSVTAGDPLRMDVVASGPIPPNSADAQGTRFAITLTDTLKPWRQYRFVVEVQAGPPPGAPSAGEIPVGEWSAPSAAVTVATIPPHIPEPPSALTLTTLPNGDVRLRVTHPQADSLVGTAFGVYRFELYRLSPGARPAKLPLTLERIAGNQFEAVDPAPPPGSAWSVRVLDPLGRPSPSLTVAGAV